MYITLIATSLVLAQSYAVPKTTNGDGMHFHFESINPKIKPEEQTSSYWIDNAQNTLNTLANRKVNQNIAKNVILFLGDGMSIPTVSAARVYNGGEEVELSFDRFPHTALSKTYAVDRQVADSANTATAYLCGVKANYGTIGIGPEIKRYDCNGMAKSDYYAYSIARHSQLANKTTGIVTTARVTHASPAGVYAHTSNRDWESDADILASNEDPNICPDIATQLIQGETGKNINVILGGGRKKFLPKDHKDEDGHFGDRQDGNNLIDKWLSERNNSKYVSNRDDLLQSTDVENLMGLFAVDHVDYNIDRNATKTPSLAEMTEVAIKILSKSQNGYFLFVEGARIDMGHHGGQARIALNETIEFAKAVQAAVDLTNEEDTLIVVTSDHAHTMSYSGYADRGHDILEFGGTADDGKVYTTLNYANGPGFKLNDPDGRRHDITQDNYKSNYYSFPAGAPMGSETHGGDDVAIFARGPWSHLFSGVLEENVIPHVMAYASCVGIGSNACDN